jgi:hypothetical protein
VVWIIEDFFYRLVGRDEEDMMKRCWVAALVVLAIGCWGENKATSRPEASSQRSVGNIVLEPDFSKSFATISETSTIIGILGEGWALQTSLPSPNATLKRGSYPVDANLMRGPDLEKYIRPSAGPPTPPLPADERYTVLPVKGLVVVVHDTVRAYGGPVILTFSGFEAGGSQFLSLGPIKLPIKGPYP